VTQSKRSDQPRNSSKGGSARTYSGRDKVPEPNSDDGNAPLFTPVDEIAVPAPTPPNHDIGEEFDIMEKDFTEFFGEVHNRFQNVIRKRHVFIYGDPYTIQGIPVAYNSATSGFNIGLRLALFNIRREDPYKAGIQIQFWESDQGKKLHRLQLDFPRIFGSEWRIKFNGEINASVSENFYGIGNMLPLDTSGTATFGARYYDFRRENYVASVKTTRRMFGTPFFITGALGYEYTRILPSAENQQIFSTRPSGIDGGITNFIGGGIMFDTRDFEPYPTKGHVTEVFVTHYPDFLESRYPFTRYTITDKHYMTLRPRIVFAHLITLETIKGNPPFFELHTVGGFDSRDVSGGRDAMRGFRGNRFLGYTRYVQQFDLRYEFGRATWFHQRFDFSFVPSLDLERVWDKDAAFSFDRVAVSGGWGVRARWNKNFVIRADFGFSRENQLLQLGFGNAF
jgi:hypothetical protein